MSNSIYVSLEAILGQEVDTLTEIKEGEFKTEKLGVIPFAAIDHPEYKQIKKDCIKMVPNKTGGMTQDLDDDKLMIKIIVAGVDKDRRSDFSFANKQLLQKLGVVSADAVVDKLLSPGEIYRMAVEIQNISGFGPEVAEELKEEVKND